MASEPFSPNRLREAMNGITNAELATKLGCSRSNISMYLNGSRTPNKMTVQLMAICLGVSPAWLMGLDVPKYVKRPTPISEDEPMDEDLIRLWKSLSPEEILRVRDFVQGMIAARKEPSSHPE